jgi:hypothetical protein
MLSLLIKKINHYFQPEQQHNIEQMDAAIKRIAQAKTLLLLRTDYLE